MHFTAMILPKMVPSRRFEYGFRGYQVPATPRAPRSVRRRVSISKKVENHKLQAFDLLAAVAGELLLEKDGFPPSNDSSSLKDQDMINADPRQLEQNAEVDCRSIEHKPLNDHGPDFKVEDDLKETKLLNCKLDEDDVKIENREKKLVSVPLSGEDTVVCSENPISSECSVPCNSFPLSGKDAKVVSRDDDDDDENLYDVNTVKKQSFTSAPRIGDRRIRKILASKYRKVASRVKDEPFTRNDGDMRGSYWARKNCYKHQRKQRIYPFKKRRLYDMHSGSKYYKKINSVDGVKLRIKSFRIPELLIEIAETATVGSLKRMVMEAVGALFGGGLHVGVLLQGKKVRDDSKTLQQTGITHENHQDSLGFTLEPNPSIAAPVAPQTAAPSIVHHEESKLLSRCLPEIELSVVPYRALDTPPKPQRTNIPEIDRDSVQSSDTTIECKALVPHPTINKENLSMVPARFKPNHRPDIGQRRVRRPFTVTEVEALVQAVENLGTGRWRDVKVQAFNDAEHRTYVDLKDKWKTLVHTARIAPQQRRGEPVPQQLLDRVLAAQAFWVPQQTKQHLPGTPTSSSALKELSY